MKIKVKQINGETTEHEVDATCLVNDFKAVLATSLDVEPERQRLIYAGRVLRNEDALSTYGVTDDCTLHLVVKPQQAASASPPSTAASHPTPAAAAPPVMPANSQVFTVPMDMGNMVVGSFNVDDGQDPAELSNLIENMIQTATQQAQTQMAQQRNAPRRGMRVSSRRQAPSTPLTQELRQSIAYAVAYLRTISPTPLLTEAVIGTASSQQTVLSRLLIDTSSALNYVQNLIHPISVRLASGLKSNSSFSTLHIVGTSNIQEEIDLNQQLHQASTSLTTLMNIAHFVSQALQLAVPSAPQPTLPPSIASAAHAYLNPAQPSQPTPISSSQSPTHPATIQPSPGASVSPARPMAPPTVAPIHTTTNPQQAVSASEPATSLPSASMSSASSAARAPSSQQLPPGSTIRIDIPNLAELGGQLPPGIAQLISGLSGVPPAAAGNAMQGLFQNMMRSAGGAATAAFNASQQGTVNTPATDTTQNNDPNSQSQSGHGDAEILTPSESSSDVSEIDMVD